MPKSPVHHFARPGNRGGVKPNRVQQGGDADLFGRPADRNSRGVPNALGGGVFDKVFGTGDADIPGGPYRNQVNAKSSWAHTLARTAPEDRGALIDNLDSAISYLQATGHSADAAQLQRMRAQVPGAGAGHATDFSTGEFSPTAAQSTYGLFDVGRNARTGVHPSQAAYNAQAQQLLAERQQEADQAFYDTQIDPALSSAQSAEQGLLDTPTYGYDSIAQQNSQAGALINGAAQDRAKSLGSLFGMTGLTSGSPALTAIGEAAARDANNQLQQALSQIQQNTTLANRSGRADAAQGLTALSTARLGARSALQSQDRGALYGAMNNVNSIMAVTQEAKRARDYQTEQQNAISDAQRRANYIKYGTAAVGLIAAPFTGGASLALLGGLANKSAAAGGGASSPYSGQGAGYGSDQYGASPTQQYGGAGLGLQVDQWGANSAYGNY